MKGSIERQVSRQIPGCQFGFSHQKELKTFLAFFSVPWFFICPSKSRRGWRRRGNRSDVHANGHLKESSILLFVSSRLNWEFFTLLDKPRRPIISGSFDTRLSTQDLGMRHSIPKFNYWLIQTNHTGNKYTPGDEKYIYIYNLATIDCYMPRVWNVEIVLTFSSVHKGGYCTKIP